jgi:hypothetical protein
MNNIGVWSKNIGFPIILKIETYIIIVKKRNANIIRPCLWFLKLQGERKRSTDMAKNKIMRLKAAVNNRRATGADYFAPMSNLAWDFWSQDYDEKVDAAARSDFLRAFLLAVVKQTAYQNSEEEYWYPLLDNGVSDPVYAVDLFDSIMQMLIPAMPGRKQVNNMFKAVRKHR